MVSQLEVGREGRRYHSQQVVEGTISNENEQHGRDVLGVFENGNRGMTTVCNRHRLPELQHSGNKEAGYERPTVRDWI